MNSKPDLARTLINATSVLVYQGGNTTGRSILYDAAEGTSENLTEIADCTGASESIFFWYWPLLIVFALTAVIGNFALLQAILFAKRFHK